MRRGIAAGTAIKVPASAAPAQPAKSRQDPIKNRPGFPKNRPDP